MSIDKEKKLVWLFDTPAKLDILEAAFGLPPEKREAFLIEKMKKHELECLGWTTKTVTELATECIKKGIRAKSFVAGKEKKE